jgi:predicted component of type VI protein secretion system
VKIVVDHVSGSRRGQRQEFDLVARIRFGRHPDNDVAFDAHRDLDASSRHAELRKGGDGYVLRDVGSSNGTFVAGERVAETAIEPGEPVLVEFGVGGPRVRIFLGDEASVAELPEIEDAQASRSSRSAIATSLALAVAVLVAAVIAVIWWRFVD